LTYRPGLAAKPARDAGQRGRAAAKAVRAGVEAVDDELTTRLSGAEMAGLSAGLVALTEIRVEAEDRARG